MVNEKTITLLVICDQQEFADQLSKILDESEQFVYEVSWCGDYTKSLEIIRKSIHQVYVIEWSFSNNQGEILLKESKDLRQKKPALVISQHSDMATNMKSIQLGASDYIPKDEVDLIHLEKSIHFSLEKFNYDSQKDEELYIYQSAVENSMDGVAMLDTKQNFTYLNKVFLSQHKYESESELIGKHWSRIYGRAEQRKMLQKVIPTVAKEMIWQGEMTGQKKDGSPFYQELTYKALEDGRNVIVIRDITESKSAQMALRQIREKFRHFFENSREGIYQSSFDGQFLSVNPTLARILRFKNEEDLIRSCTDLSSLYVKPGRREELLKALQENDNKIMGFESEVFCKDGCIIWISENIQLIHSEKGTPFYLEGTVDDISRRKESETSLIQLAYFDNLTGLANRTSLQKHLYSRINRSIPPHFALIVGDLDRFRIIHESLGLSSADQLIIDVSKRISQKLPPDSTLFRIGGDSFAIILEVEDENKASTDLAENILEALQKPFMLKGHEIFISMSLGIVESTMSFHEPEGYLRSAETAMSLVKNEGGNAWKFFVKEMQTFALNRLEIEEEMRSAIENGEFVVYYQPIVSSETGKVVGGEALVRWYHPTKGFMSPAEFIPVAEETGLIVELGEFVLREACRQTQEWHNRGLKDFYISVNVSMRQFTKGDFSSKVFSALNDTGLKNHFLKLEITESMAMQSVDHTLSTLKELTDNHIQLSIDDFGTGYSSLAYLQKFPFHNLKIDRAFVKDLDQNNLNSSVMVRIIAALAESLHLQIVAEGVETNLQLQMLMDLGVNTFQGFFFGRPIPGSDFFDWIKNFKGEEFFQDKNRP